MGNTMWVYTGRPYASLCGEFLGGIELALYRQQCNTNYDRLCRDLPDLPIKEFDGIEQADGFIYYSVGEVDTCYAVFKFLGGIECQATASIDEAIEIFNYLVDGRGRYHSDIFLIAYNRRMSMNALKFKVLSRASFHGPLNNITKITN